MEVFSAISRANFTFPPSSSTNPANHGSSSSFEHQRILNLFILDCTTDGLLDINPLSIQIITTNSPRLLQTTIQRSSLTMHHSQLLDTAISPKMRSRLSSWSVLPADVLFSVHRNSKDKYSLPMCFLLSSYSRKKRARRGSS